MALSPIYKATHTGQQIDNAVDKVATLEVDLGKKYVKPATGIPASDLAEAVQASLGKADSAIQSAELESAIQGVNTRIDNLPEDKNTTYTFSDGTSDGTFKVKASDSEDTQAVAIGGLKSAAYQEASAFDAAGVAEAAASAVDAKVTTLAGRVKTLEDNPYNDEEVRGLISANTSAISANTSAISTLNGEGVGSVKKTVADEIAKVVASAPGDFDTLKEIADWISGHANDVTEMNSNISANTSGVAANAGNITALQGQMSDVLTRLQALETLLSNDNYDIMLVPKAQEPTGGEE